MLPWRLTYVCPQFTICIVWPWYSHLITFKKEYIILCWYSQFWNKTIKWPFLVYIHENPSEKYLDMLETENYNCFVWNKRDRRSIEDRWKIKKYWRKYKMKLSNTYKTFRTKIITNTGALEIAVTIQIKFCIQLMVYFTNSHTWSFCIA